jgi:FKBP-type peptidyl-prolyl cis-trans isomerase
MKYTLAIAALVSNSQAIQQKTAASPDVYGENGTGYSNTDASYDLSRIGIDITKAGTGNDCKVGDWTSLHWTATLMDGRVVSDSRAELGGLPKTFALGAHEVFSCWDLAVPKLKQGAKARLTCPSYFAWGGARTWAPIGGEPIPLHSDVYFDVEVVECNRTPEFTGYYT